MAGPRWLLALIVALVIELAFAVVLFVVELHSGTRGTVFAVAELIWVALGFAVVIGCISWFLTARRELDRRAQVLTVAAATSHEWQWETDVDDVFTYSNDAVVDLLGYCPDDLVGSHSFDLLYDSSARDKAIPLHDAATRAPHGWTDRELTWRHRDGSPVRLEGSAAAIRDHRGRVVGYRGTRRLVAENRPSRDVGATPTAQFLASIGFPDDNPPNAAIVIDDGNGGTDIAVVELRNPLIDPTGPSIIYDMTVLENWEDSTELGLQDAPADLSDLPENLGPTHLFIDDCPNDAIHCNTPGYAPTQVGSYDNQPFCYNYLLCIPCEPYGHTQPDRCATITYWIDKCSADYAQQCPDSCDAQWPSRGLLGC